MRLSVLNTERLSIGYRKRAIDLQGKRVLITTFHGSQQELDFTEPANCGGAGRIRHFRRKDKTWPDNPLPIDPACTALGMTAVDEMRAQVFQNAVCNWRCWYCFVDFDLLSANPKHSTWKTAEELVDLYLGEQSTPSIIDLTGGQPDLTPEWVVWMMQALRQRSLEDSVYLWSDDNLSNDYFWRYLSPSDRDTICHYPNYGRVCCFKGFDNESFAFNTSANPGLFEQQFELFTRLMECGLDIYGYVTMTCPSTDDLGGRVRRFVDRLQKIHPLVPLRVIPLRIRLFTPVETRLDQTRREAIRSQLDAVNVWNEELDRRFSRQLRTTRIDALSLIKGGSHA